MRKRVLRVKDLSYYEHTDQGEKMIFKNVSFTLYDSDILCIVGPSGSGRSSLLKVIAGLYPPTEGSIHFDYPKRPDQDLVTMTFEEANLLPWMNIEENMLLALEHLPISEAEKLRRIAEVLDKFGLSGYEDNYPFELTRSLRMKAAIARAVALKPVVLLLDEPLANLDALSRVALREELISLLKDKTAPNALVVSINSVEDAVLMADEVLILDPEKGMKKRMRIGPERPRNPKDKKLEAYVDDVYTALME